MRKIMPWKNWPLERASQAEGIHRCPPSACLPSLFLFWKVIEKSSLFVGFVNTVKSFFVVVNFHPIFCKFFTAYGPTPQGDWRWLAWNRGWVRETFLSSCGEAGESASWKWEIISMQKIYKTLPEAQRTQGIESVTWIIFFSQDNFKLILVRLNTLGPLCLWQCFQFVFNFFLQLASLVLVPCLATR